MSVKEVSCCHELGDVTNVPVQALPVHVRLQALQHYSVQHAIAYAFLYNWLHHPGYNTFESACMSKLVSVCVIRSKET
jgi:hypothetical protein